MAKREEFSLTLEWCQRIAEVALAGRANFPKKWGEKAIPEEEQLIGREDLGSLFQTLRSYSPWMQGIGEGFRTLFGDKEDWYPLDKDGKRLDVKISSSDPRITSWQMVDSSKIYKLRLGREALSGIVWCCILRLHAHCIIPTTTREAVDIWWPITEAIGKTTAVKKYVGIAAAKRNDWEDDADASETAKVETAKP